MATSQPSSRKESFEKLAQLIEILGEKCVWDRKQTPETIFKALQGEVKEVEQALQSNDAHELQEEIGDVLWDVLFFINLAKKRGLFDVKDVLDFMHEKMVKRHPHVFLPQDRAYAERLGLRSKDGKSADPVDINFIESTWEQIKKEEREQRPKRDKKLIHNGIKAVIFDWDGVLLNTLPTQFKIYKKIEEAMGLRFGFDLDQQDNGNHFECNFKLHYNQALGRDATADEIAKASRIYREHLTHFNDGLKLFEGIVPLIHELKQRGYKLGIVSNSFRDFIIEKLEEAGIFHCFDEIMGHEHGILKPNPDGILECIHRMGIFPEETAYVGDMDGDVIAAKKANVKKMIAVTYGYHTEEKLKPHDPHHLINKPTELLTILIS
ncbi:TPA: HAD-IA family hydrolase [Candidatus Woesearchaeota archaeon]|nr:HAD-IA family hydrolase [Candidatus Woesearchaeota archaeon]